MMTENKAKTYSVLIKTGIALIFCIFAIILISQYISLNQLNAKNNELTQQYQSLVKEDEELTKQKTQIEENYEDYVTDVARDKYNLTQDDEILINKNQTEQ